MMVRRAIVRKGGWRPGPVPARSHIRLSCPRDHPPWPRTELREADKVLHICDVQTKFEPHIHCMPAVVWTARAMAAAAGLFGHPVVVTEQVPSKLGPTVPEVLAALPEGAVVRDKRSFSMVPAVEEAGLVNMRDPVKEAVIVGIETHVCVQQTALDYLAMGVPVTIIADGVSSQREADRDAALRLLARQGALVTTAESYLFALLGSSEHEHFRAVSKLMQAERPAEWLK